MIESLICLHREVSCIKMIMFSFESRTCLDSKCLINLLLFFFWLKIFFNGRCLLVKGRKKDRRAGFLFFWVLLLRVYQGRNCFIMLWRITCLLESFEQRYAWTVGDVSVPGEWKGGVPADSTPLCAAVLEKGFGVRRGLVLSSIRRLQKECWQTQMLETRSWQNDSRSWQKKMSFSQLSSVIYHYELHGFNANWPHKVSFQFHSGSPEEGLGFGIYMGQFSASANGFLQVRADEKTATTYFRTIEISVISRLQDALKTVNVFLSQKWEVVFASNSCSPEIQRQ